MISGNKMKKAFRTLFIVVTLLAIANPVFSQRRDPAEKNKGKGHQRYGGIYYDSSYEVLDEKQLITDPDKSDKKVRNEAKPIVTQPVKTDAKVTVKKVAVFKVTKPKVANLKHQHKPVPIMKSGK